MADQIHLHCHEIILKSFYFLLLLFHLFFAYLPKYLGPSWFVESQNLFGRLRLKFLEVLGNFSLWRFDKSLEILASKNNVLADNSSQEVVQNFYFIFGDLLFICTYISFFWDRGDENARPSAEKSLPELVEVWVFSDNLYFAIIGIFPSQNVNIGFGYAWSFNCGFSNIEPWLYNNDRTFLYSASTAFMTPSANLLKFLIAFSSLNSESFQSNSAGNWTTLFARRETVVSTSGSC